MREGSYFSHKVSKDGKTIAYFKGWQGAYDFKRTQEAQTLYTLSSEERKEFFIQSIRDWKEILGESRSWEDAYEVALDDWKHYHKLTKAWSLYEKVYNHGADQVTPIRSVKDHLYKKELMAEKYGEHHN